MAEHEHRTAPEEALRACLATLAHRPAGLVTDIDGTVSAIAPTPEAASVGEAARDVLRRLTRRLALVGVVTGRSAADARAMVAVPELVYVGNHGMERFDGGGVWRHPGAAASSDALAAALAEIAAGMAAAGLEAGVIVENKRLSGSVHYRLSPEPERARAVLLDEANGAAARHGLRVTEGRLIVEIRPRVQVNKGTALADLVAERGLAGVVFLGDDLTDVDGFKAVGRLREEGVAAGLRVAVLSAETQPDVLAESDVRVYGVDECVALLGAVADELDRGERGS